MAAAPTIAAFYTSLYRSYQALPRNAANCLWGLGVCFFGGRYAAALAAAEAFRTSGGTLMLECLEELKEDADRVLLANIEDDKKDEDGDGQLDVLQLPSSQLLRRKLSLVLRTVDPNKVTMALSGLWAGYLGIIVTLKFKFARTVALAHSMGDNLRPIAAKLLAPTALSVTPPEYRQWVSPAINLSCKCIAVFVAWRLQQALSSVQSGVAGGLLAARGFLLLLQDSGYVEPGVLDTMADEVLGWCFAAAGIYYQLIKGAPIPFLISPVLWPIDFAEKCLQWSVAAVSDRT